MMSEKAKLKGALAAIERKVARATVEMDEFNESRPPTFEATRRIMPNPTWDGVVRKVLEIRVATSYANVKGDDDEVHRLTEENAMRQLCSFLYEDVLHDLHMIMSELGGGKRRNAMHLVSDLMQRLTGYQASDARESK
jgi:hypothetical protein